VTGVKYNQERFPLNTRAAQKILIVPVQFFQAEHLFFVASTDLQTSAPQVPGFPELLSILFHLHTVVLDSQCFPISIIFS
jgi:hypothetical protein